MLDNPEEIEAPKTHSIVSEECELRPNHIGMPVTYKNVTGFLIRYITSCEHNLLELTDAETRACIDAHTSAELP